MYTPFYREMLDETVRRERRAFESHYTTQGAGSSKKAGAAAAGQAGGARKPAPGQKKD